MDDPIVIFSIVATILFLAITAAFVMLRIQRRRHRHMQLMTMAFAQQDAERRRRERRKAGLRKWEIDSVSPEAVFTHASSISSPLLYKLDNSPAEYLAAVAHLPRPHHVSPPPPVYPAPPDVPPHAIVLPDTDHTCVICLEDVLVGHHVRALPCHHIFHAHCIRVWLRRRNACPCCCDKVIRRRGKKPQQQDNLAPPPPVRLDDRPADSASGPLLKAFGEETEVSFDRLNSETSLHLDQVSAAELLSQVRRALRGESSAISLNTSVADLEDTSTFRSFPDLPSLGFCSVDADEAAAESEPQHAEISQRQNVTENVAESCQDQVQIREKSTETVVEFEGSTSDGYMTPPLEQVFNMAEPY